MAKVFIEETTLSAIGDAIRTKTETTELINPTDMAEKIEGITTGGNTAELTITSNGTYRAPEGIDGYTPVIVNVPQDSSPPPEAFAITGDCNYRFANGGWDWFLNMYGNQITTKDITNSNNMFVYSKITKIPFTINIKDCNCYYMFSQSAIEALPEVVGKISNANNMFYDCKYLRDIPDNFGEKIDWSIIDNSNKSYDNSTGSMFYSCGSLRRISENILCHCNKYSSYNNSIFNSGFYSCYVLDELVNLPIPDKTAWTSNGFRNFVDVCNRLKKLTFKMNEDGTPINVKWKSQTITLSNNIGYAPHINNIINLNSGITEATRITDDATYQALKDNPDSWTTDINYSRYNRTSAVETINSLPDTSAYLAEKGGTNTIKFKGASGALTDGGAINTMTEEEIAVATAKGWSVAFV